MTLLADAELVARAFDAALASGDAAGLAALLADRATLHADGVSLRRDLGGKGAVAAYFGRYMERFTYHHRVLCGATSRLSPTRAAAAALYADEGVAPITPRGGGRGGGEEGGALAAAKAGSTVLGASFYEMEAASPGAPPRITDIYLTRQLTDDEAGRKLGGRPHADYTALAGLPPPSALEGSAATHSPARAARHAAAAAEYNAAWASGDVAAAAPLLSPSFVGANLLTATEFHGVDGLRSAVRGLFDRWTPVWHESVVVVTPGNKAFTLWKGAGDALIVDDEGGAVRTTFATAWGLTLLIFDEADEVAAALAFAPPLPGGRGALAAHK